MRDLRTNTRTVCENIQSNGESIITNKGKPTFLVLDISKNDFELMLRSIRQAKAMIAFNNMRAIAAENGYMSDEEIEAEISAARRELRERLSL